jgi:hypothetical protein
MAQRIERTLALELCHDGQAIERAEIRGDHHWDTALFRQWGREVMSRHGLTGSGSLYVWASLADAERFVSEPSKVFPINSITVTV